MFTNRFSASTSFLLMFITVELNVAKLPSKGGAKVSNILPFTDLCETLRVCIPLTFELLKLGTKIVPCLFYDSETYAA